MEYVPGHNLARLLGKRASGRTGRCLAAHDSRDRGDGGCAWVRAPRLRRARPRSGIVHRDISPQTCSCRSVMWKLMDFGIAKAANKSPELEPAWCAGSSRTCRPEQVLGDEARRVRSDVFSTGIMLWEATLGRRLFTESQRRRDHPDALRGKPIPHPAWIGLPGSARRDRAPRSRERDHTRRTSSVGELARSSAAYSRWSAGASTSRARRARPATRAEQREEARGARSRANTDDADGSVPPTRAMPPLQVQSALASRWSSGVPRRRWPLVTTIVVLVGGACRTRGPSPAPRLEGTLDATPRRSRLPTRGRWWPLYPVDAAAPVGSTRRRRRRVRPPMRVSEEATRRATADPPDADGLHPTPTPAPLPAAVPPDRTARRN